MKKLFVVALACTVLACNEKEEQPKDYVTFSGQITNMNSDSIFVRSRDYSKTIKVNTDGTFSDTLKINEPGTFTVGDGTEVTSVFLKNGYDIKMTIDTKMFDETVKYTGEGSENSNFLAQNSLKQEALLDLDELSKLEDTVALNEKFESLKTEFNNFYEADKTIDSTLIESSKKQLDPMLGMYKSFVKQKIDLNTNLPKGADSPNFEGFENHAGGKTSLADLKGKYTYIDIWATWCGPCKAEIPSLKEVEEKYHDKNIQFVSISIDDDRTHKDVDGKPSWEEANADWKEFVTGMELGGIQLFAPNGWQTEFIQDYYITGIPRFILLDPNGKVVSADAPRPSSEELIKLFDAEGI
ncbi:TlpA family protein disulfide reductase [Mangrovimonas sp. AS39]|uniref:TlpA family protein disulfide reductase n=1 Tax=Mangrovimonas futianensis TaxID=2895523 RepID=UPI001E455B09|nr:TlpA disulfide reductase family protein [Mangrovimonas futianensis]MCF1191836.1 TlpA family protein disulfide reductase [Mangrovimonas futianensis]MCF1195276.1 TlpA family protein disulfide reductase [Mangrovimonas futianensis]